MNELNALHGALAKYFVEFIESGEEVSSGTLSAAIAFLKNNNITVDVIEADVGHNMGMKLLSLVDEAKEA